MTLKDALTDYQSKVKHQHQAIYDAHGLDPLTKRITVPKKKKGFLHCVRRAFEGLINTFNRIFSKPFRKKVVLVQDFVDKGIKLTDRIVRFVSKIFSGAQSGAEAVHAVNKISSTLKKGVEVVKTVNNVFKGNNRESDVVNVAGKIASGVQDGAEAVSAINSESSCKMPWLPKLKVLAGVDGIIAIVDIVKNALSFEKACRKKDDSWKVDAALSIAKNVSDLSRAVAGVLEGIGHFGVTSSALTAVSTSLTGVGIIFSTASAVLNAKHWYESCQFRKQMIEKFDGQPGNFKNVMEFIHKKSDRTLTKFTGVKKAGKLKAQMEAIWRKNKELDTDQKKENVKKTMSAWKTRVKWKNIVNALKTIAAVVSVIASAVLFFTPFAPVVAVVLVPVGFGLLAACTATNITTQIMDLVAKTNFCKELKKLVSDTEPEIVMAEWQEKKKKWRKSVQKMWDVKFDKFPEPNQL